MKRNARDGVKKKFVALSSTLALSFALSTTFAFAEELLGKNAVQDQDTGFTIQTLFISDPDWRQKWAKPSEERPEFNVTQALAEGEEGTLLIFFSHPTVTGGQARLQCELTIRDSNANIARSSHVCFEQEIVSPVHYVFLAALVVTYIHKPTDQAGIVTIDAEVTDLNSGAHLSQSSVFQLVKQGTE